MQMGKPDGEERCRKGRARIVFCFFTSSEAVVVEKTGDKIELAGEDCASGRKEKKERAFRASLEVLFLAGEG